ncbi:proton-conducting transporter membrane subunit, partial [Georgenia sp. 10Sc9-8]|nr:proton-conducting transporter membrane subunit [Georgenia halotolerans]
ATHLSQWAGLGRRSPVTAVTMVLFLASFAGIPLTAGFMGKFAVFSAGVVGGQTVLVVLAVLASAATAFFYVRLIVLMFFTEPDGQRTAVVSSEGLTAVAVGVAAVGTVLLGVLPGPVLDLAGRAAMFLP